MKKIGLSFLLCIMSVNLLACSNQNTNSENTAEAVVVEEDDQGSKEVDSIDYTTENGNVKYVGYEFVDSDFLKFEKDIDQNKAVILKFDFTNLKDAPQSASSAYYFKFYQNGTELDTSITYNGNAEQTKYINNYTNSVMKDGTTEFGEFVVLQNDSPVTIQVIKNGGSSSEDYQMAEVVIDVDMSKSNETDKNPTAQKVFEDNGFTISDENVSGDKTTFKATIDGYAFNVEAIKYENKGVASEKCEELSSQLQSSGAYKLAGTRSKIAGKIYDLKSQTTNELARVAVAYDTATVYEITNINDAYKSDINDIIVQLLEL